MGNGNEFDQIFEGALRERGNAPVPGGLQQRLLARLAQEEREPFLVRAPGPRRFGLPEQVSVLGHVSSLWFALGAHALAIAVIAILMARHVQLAAPTRPQVTVSLVSPPPPPIAPRAATMAGGGGQHDLAAAAQGRLPRFAKDQIVPPMAPPVIAPRLAVEPTVVVQKNLQMAENTMPNLGLPNSSLHGVSLGSGSGTGIGSGEGLGIGPGAGGEAGGGLMHIGGAIRAPLLIYHPDAEFSEEARKAKFSGNVQIYLWIDEQGNPSHIRVARGVGMGLDEKAIEAVRQYKFKPAMLNGKPVKVDMYVDVDFTIL